MSRFIRSAAAIAVLFGGLSGYAHAGLINTSGTEPSPSALTDTNVNTSGLDDEGIDQYVSPSDLLDNTGVGSPLAHFSLENAVEASHPIVAAAPGNGGNPASSVPEPSTLALMLLASGAMLGVARKKQ